MKIFVQARDLDDARIDGTRVYIHRVLEHWSQDQSIPDDITVVHGAQFNPELSVNFRPQFQELSLAHWPLWMQTIFAWRVWKDRPDVVWLPLQALPLWRHPRVRYVATIHDLAFLQYPDTFPRRDRFKLRFFLWLIVRSRVDIIAVSQATREALLDYAPMLSPKRIRVIYHGGGQVTSGTSPVEPSNSLVFVGGLQPRKNLERLIRVHQQYWKSKITLHILGKPAWRSSTIVQAIRAATGVVWQSDPDRTSVVQTLRGALAMVYPSLSEGFGMPIVEAQECGVAVVTSLGSSLPEVGGEGALYCDPRSDVSLYRATELIVQRQELRRWLVARGTRECQRFNWQHTAEETLDYLTKSPLSTGRE